MGRERRRAVDLLGALWRGSGTGRLVLAAIAVSAAIVLAVPCSERVARTLMGKFHLRQPFLGWAALQVVPSMYNFANVAEIRWRDPARPPETLWINHYPLRVVTYMRRLAFAAAPAVLTVESRYGGAEVGTRCHVEPRDGAIHVSCEAAR